MKNKLLTIKDLHKVYYSKNAEIEAIKNITFDLYEGEFISIVGPSGCGKSTFLNILTKMDNLTSGEIIFSNPNLKFGYMLQSDSLLPWKTVFENAILGLEIKKIKNNTNLNYVHKLLNTYGLKDFKDKYPHELSGGMRQRVVWMQYRHKAIIK